MKAERAVSIRDLRILAQRRLPRVLFDLVDGASEDERAKGLNERRLAEYSLVPRVLRGVTARDQSTTLFGRKYASCFGIAPTGSIGILRRNIEFMLAEAAAQADIPVVLSGGSAEPLSAVAARAPELVWSQLFSAEDPGITEVLVERAEAAHVPALVWTVDVPVVSKNDRLLRNGFRSRPRLRLADRLEATMHPQWLYDYLRSGMPRMAQWEPFAEAGASAFEVRSFFMSQRNVSQSWKDLEKLRRLWKRPLLLKGILHPDDAVRGMDCGADAVIVSNHGGYALDRAPASIDVLADVARAVGRKMPVLFDGGVRRGADIVLARCLGAQFVFVGRATLYGAVADGKEGTMRAIDILKDEIDRTMGQLGCRSLDELGPEYIKTQP